MGAKFWMLVYADDDARAALSVYPELDREATARLAAALFPDERLEPTGDANLWYIAPPEREALVGCFPGVSVVTAGDVALDYPSQLPARFVAAGGRGVITLHAMHSVVGWSAFARWEGGQLRRSLSLAPDDGIIENIGEPLPFEVPYWAGEHPTFNDEDDDGEGYPFPFHPLVLGKVALRELLGYQIEGSRAPGLLDPERIPLVRFRRTARR